MQAKERINEIRKDRKIVYKQGNTFKESNRKSGKTTRHYRH